jgi:uncharacterized protein (DUF736 family)
MIIGTFTKGKKGITGSITTFGAALDNVSFRPIEASGNGPDYVVEANGAELGAAWEKTSKAGGKYLSVGFKGPFLSGQVYAALVESTKTSGTYSLLWSEPKEADAA